MLPSGYGVHQALCRLQGYAAYCLHSPAQYWVRSTGWETNPQPWGKQRRAVPLRQWYVWPLWYLRWPGQLSMDAGEKVGVCHPPLTSPPHSYCMQGSSCMLPPTLNLEAPHSNYNLNIVCVSACLSCRGGWGHTAAYTTSSDATYAEIYAVCMP